MLEAENARKNAEANYFEIAKSPERLSAMAEAEMARFITEQQNNIRQFQSDTLKKISDLRQARALKLQEYQEGAPEIKEIDAQITSYQNSIDNAVQKFQNDLDKYRDSTKKTLITCRQSICRQRPTRTRSELILTSNSARRLGRISPPSALLC
ncbi:MAG: hypothetical protein R2682_13540 [Pyrinomonadaceae bacterium]